MESPNYYGILPANVRYDKNLKPMEKIVYCEITALSNKNGYCHASNSYFAQLYEVHKNTVGVWINHLVECKYLRAELIYKAGTKEVKERKLYISLPTTETPQEKDCDSINENNDTSQQKDCDSINKNTDTPQQKDCDPINKKIEDNITSRILKDTHTGGEGETDVDLKPKGEVKPKDKQQSNGESEEKLELSDNIPIEIQDILKKYNELKLPEYDYRPDNYILLGVCRELGAVKLFEALTLMSQSEFVKNNLSINTIFKIENLKKALNGNFKDRERKSYKKDDFKKSFERPVYEDFTGELIDRILNETLGGE
ncbi:helix-turn-helix domain-containing protein [Fusobacterium ulcerans]|uniref:helix-turn-helix domain-containing protein n=1 Tax=Fusobacterium ulcerans TaxID=861 RepID=UPI001D0B2DF3|nr:helix-turn-helix domain-containing protein [Fusobacterium ulcerans]MCB8565780.1 helix-turn-helix domain-containing protein [Fusobacterium ulcerans]MCB8650648.1 helix-turn-helix domain-containing protein [Fusobacterium ulcerans]